MNEQILKRWRQFQQQRPDLKYLDLGKLEIENISLADKNYFSFIKGQNKYVRKSIAASPGDIPVVGASLENECIYDHVTPLKENDVVNKPCISFNKDNAKGSRAFFRDYPFVMDRHHIAILPDLEKVSPRFLQVYLDYILSKGGFGWGENVASEATVKKFNVPIPNALEACTSLDIQKSLVDFIEYEFNTVDRTLNHMRDTMKIYERLRRMVLPNTFAKTSGFTEAFNNWSIRNSYDLRLEEVEFEEKELNQVAELMMGQSPSGKDLNNEGKGLPFHQGKTYFGKKFLQDPKVWTTNSKRVAKKGDILVSMRAPAGAVNITNYETSIGRGLAAARPRASLTFDFLYFILKENEKRIEIAGDNGGMFSSITSGYLRSLKVPIPKSSSMDTKQIQNLLNKFISISFSEIDEKEGHYKNVEHLTPIYKQLLLSTLFISMKSNANGQN